MPLPLHELEEAAKGLARTIGASLPEGVGFALLLFDFGDPGTGNLTYLSNAKRDDMLAALREFMQKVGH